MTVTDTANNRATITAESVVGTAPVIPVITIENVDTAVPMAEALVAGGLPVLEITLRTPGALSAISAIRKSVTNALVGAGTVVNANQLQAVLEAGAQFVVTPGATPALLEAGVSCGVPFLPGVATASEIIRCMEAGFSTLKFFPAEAAGGIKTLRAFAGPFSGIRFCPTGGISIDNFRDYLALDTVSCVGGSWLTPKEHLQKKDWQAIKKLAQAVSGHD